MKLSELSCADFAKELSLKKPVPGGGGTAALVGALGTALSSMVANYSIGKKKLIQFNEQHENIIQKGEFIRNKLIELIDKDAENFEPLSRAYGLPSETDEERQYKDEVMEDCLKNACSAPLDMLNYIHEAILLHKELLNISSQLIISDIGVGTECLRAALNSAYLNVLINIKLIKDEDYIRENNTRSLQLLEEGNKIADEVYEQVLIIMNGQE